MRGDRGSFSLLVLFGTFEFTQFQALLLDLGRGAADGAGSGAAAGPGMWVSAGEGPGLVLGAGL